MVNSRKEELQHVENRLSELLSKLNEKLISNIADTQPLQEPAPTPIQPPQEPAPTLAQPPQESAPTQAQAEGRCIRKINRFFMKYF
jgi:hypothetical protein